MPRIGWRGEATVTDPDGELVYESAGDGCRIGAHALGRVITVRLSRDAAVALARRILLDNGEDPDRQESWEAEEAG